MRSGSLSGDACSRSHRSQCGGVHPPICEDEFSASSNKSFCGLSIRELQTDGIGSVRGLFRAESFVFKLVYEAAARKAHDIDVSLRYAHRLLVPIGAAVVCCERCIFKGVLLVFKLVDETRVGEPHGIEIPLGGAQVRFFSPGVTLPLRLTVGSFAVAHSPSICLVFGISEVMVSSHRMQVPC